MSNTPGSAFTPIFALHRYFIWASRMRKHFHATLDKRTSLTPPYIEQFMYMSYWYAALFVVVEGWRDLELSDERIDALLKSENVELLRRYRNGTFHFQKRYFDERFLDFFAGEGVVVWVEKGGVKSFV